jgi:hypothetical protein
MMWAVTDDFPSPTRPAASRAEVILGYLDYFRTRVAAKVDSLSAAEQPRTQLPSGWTPLELVKHLTYVERRWLEWGFEGRPIDDPWGDQRDGRWHVHPDETPGQLPAALRVQGERSRAVIEHNAWPPLGDRDHAGMEPSPPPSNAACSTSSKSTHAISGTSTLSPSSPAANSANNRPPVYLTAPREPNPVRPAAKLALCVAPNRALERRLHPL